MQSRHLAQLNIAKAKADLGAISMQGFVERLDEINKLAESADGFVWRLVSDDDLLGEKYFQNRMIIVNMSVWSSLEQLRHFVYQSAHLELLKGKDQWFKKLDTAHQVLWWVPAGHIPDLAEAGSRLDHLNQHGPTEKAFTFARPFEP